MQKKIPVLLLFVLFACHIKLYAQQRGDIDVYLMGGQSNATGQGYLANLPGEIKIDTSVLIFHSGQPHLNSGGQPYLWVPLRQASESPDRFGPELGFGNTLHALLPASKIAIIKHAHSGTSLYKDWWPGNNNTDSVAWGNQYAVFVKTVLQGLLQLKAMGYTPHIKAMLWQQGEADADKAGDTAKAYGKNLQHFIRRVRQQFNNENILFVYGYVYPPPNMVQGSLAVRKGQYEVSEAAKSIWSVRGAYIVPTDDLDHRAHDKGTHYPQDHIHFGTAGTWELGKRMATTVAAVFKNKL